MTEETDLPEQIFDDSMRADGPLTGRLLVATPGMSDPRFDKSVIYICAHSDDGTMGIIINKPAESVTFPELMKQLGIQGSNRGIQVHFGGPVEMGRGFVLHSNDWQRTDATMQMEGGVCLTATTGILRDIACGAGPQNAIFALGYAGWGPGQLESEIQRNDWLDCDADPDLIYGRNDEKWMGAMAAIGIDPLLLSGTAGSA